MSYQEKDKKKNHKWRDELTEKYGEIVTSDINIGRNKMGGI